MSGEKVQPKGPTADRRRRKLLVIAGAIALADQLTKTVALNTLDDGALHVVGDVVQLRLTRNSGAAFSLLSGLTPLLTLLAAGAVLMVASVGRRSDDRLTVLAWSMVLGGALGNLADRVARTPGFPSGEVVDFVKVGWWPTFNLADAAITLGVALLLVRTWRDPTRRDPARRDPA